MITQLATYRRALHDLLERGNRRLDVQPFNRYRTVLTLGCTATDFIPQPLLPTLYQSILFFVTTLIRLIIR